MHTLNKNKWKTAGYALLLLLYTGVGAMAYRLFLRQALHFQGPLGEYASDLPEHILEGTVGSPYSLMERSFGFLMGTLKLNEKSVAVWLALLTLGTVWMTWRLMKMLMPQGSALGLHFLAFACCFVMPLYIPAIHPQRYMGLQSGTIWHNSTYMGMKFAAVLLLIFYFRYQERYEKKFAAGDFVIFTLLLILVNLMKPNFLLCFAPAMAAVLLGDCIASRGKTLKRQILFGIPVLISLAVIIYETMVLFSGERSESSITLALAYGLRLRTKHPVASLIQSAAFPLLVLAGNLEELKKDRVFRTSWLIWLFGLLEYLFLCETGPRKDHGNFSWGYSFCVFLVFAVCACLLYRNCLEFYRCCRQSGGKTLAVCVKTEGKKVTGRLAWLAASVLLLIWHLLCGIRFFWILFQGGSYFS